MTLRVLGIDPGLSRLGWGVIESSGPRLVHVGHGTLGTEAGEPLEARLLALHRGIAALIEAYRPAAVGVETLFFTKNVSSAIPVAHARGVVLLAAAQAGLCVGEFSPVTIKQAVVGAGGAGKTQVQAMVKLLLGLPAPPEPDHAADALAAAITFVNTGAPWSTASAAS